MMLRRQRLPLIMTLTHTIAHDGQHTFYHPSTGKYLNFNGNEILISESVTAPFKGATSTVSCVLGTIKLKINRYLIVVDRHELAGLILGNEIAQVKSTKIFPLGKDDVSKKDSEESQYLALLREHLKKATLYFSINNSYDLTNSLQRQFASTSHVDIDRRFWWNHYLCEELLNNDVGSFVTPVIYGYFKLHSAQFNGGQTLDFAMVTRRSPFRAGTRYFRRGIDEGGDVANFNETEQILTTSDAKIFSFLQTRGSVPVYWSEINNLRYKPNLVISSRSAREATARHFEDQVKLYGDIFCVNLVNLSGYEEPVKLAYEKAVEALPDSLKKHVTYIYFDFHHECRKMRWDRVRLLIEHLVDLGFTNDNYFGYDLNTKTVLSLQEKIVRTNCMDCLDRTNVVQSMLARWVLQRQFQKTHYLPEDSMSPWELVDPQFNLFFQNFWADNADAVSCAYSGTGALKTDYTRTGKRTKMGALYDLMNSITRYYLNNYKDGLRQDSYDLFLGKYRPFRDAIRNPFVDRRSPYIQLAPYLIGVSLFMLTALLIYPSGLVWSWSNLLFMSGCIYFGFKNLSFVINNGYQFVNWPKLSPLDYLKKADVFNLDGKFVGSSYEENDDFKTSKKRN